MAAKDDLAKAQAALEQGVRTYSFEGKTYDLAGLRKLVEETLPAQVKKETAEAKKAAAASKAAAKLRDPKLAQQAVNQAQQEFDDAVKRFLDRNVTQSFVDAARTKLAQAQETLARLTPTPTAPVTTPVTTTPAAAPSDDSSLKAEAARLARLAADKGGVGGAKVPGAGTTPKQPGDKKPAETNIENILNELATQFPAYQDWTLEQATGYFGADLIKVLTDTANGVYGTGANKNKEAIARAIEGTTYWRTTVSSIRNWDALAKPDQDRRVVDQKRLLAQTFGELQLDDATLTDLATTIQRTGLSDLGAKQLVYGAAFARPRSELGPQPAKLALESAAADEIRKIARAYGYMPSDIDNQIQAILTGKPYAATGTVLTTDSFRQKAQKAAQGSFRHLKDQFDAGLTLDDVFGNYQAIASRVLEIDPSEIDYMKDWSKWGAAFGNDKDGLPSLSAWVQKLKTDPAYGYQFTTQANAEVSNVVSTLEKAFGFRK